jgi:hypothetical protein
LEYKKNKEIPTMKRKQANPDKPPDTGLVNLAPDDILSVRGVLKEVLAGGDWSRLDWTARDKSVRRQ